MSGRIQQIQIRLPEPPRANSGDSGLTPRYTHDCPRCLFLGRALAYDAYYCKSSIAECLDTMVLRNGDGGPQYWSMHLEQCRTIAAEGDPRRDVVRALRGALGALDALREELGC